MQLVKTNARRWGNSLGVRIPQLFAKEIGIQDGSSLEINLVKGKIVLSPSKATLEELMKQVAVQNIHGETNAGGVKGKELW